MYPNIAAREEERRIWREWLKREISRLERELSTNIFAEASLRTRKAQLKAAGEWRND